MIEHVELVVDKNNMIYELIYVYMLMIIIRITCWWNITWRYVYMLMNYYMHAYVEFNMMFIWYCN